MALPCSPVAETDPAGEAASFWSAMLSGITIALPEFLSKHDLIRNRHLLFADHAQAVRKFRW
jgi:hypothetical protein